MERSTLITISMVCLTIVSIFLIGWNVLLKNMDTCNVEYHCFEDNKNCSIILPISKNESLPPIILEGRSSICVRNGVI